MSEDHIKTLVLDPPPAQLVDDEKSEERRGTEASKSDEPSSRGPSGPAGSWLS